MSSIRNAKVKRCDVSLPPLPKPSNFSYTDSREREIRELATTWVDEDDGEQVFCDDEPSSPPSSPRKKKKDDDPEPKTPVAMTEEELEDERELEELRGYLLEPKSAAASKAPEDSAKPPAQPKPKPGKFQGRLSQMKKESRDQAKQMRLQAEVNRKAWRQEQNRDDDMTEAILFGEDDSQSSPPSPSLVWD